VLTPVRISFIAFFYDHYSCHRRNYQLQCLPGGHDRRDYNGLFYNYKHKVNFLSLVKEKGGKDDNEGSQTESAHNPRSKLETDGLDGLQN
jgi:hypothetical protein